GDQSLFVGDFRRLWLRDPRVNARTHLQGRRRTDDDKFHWIRDVGHRAQSFAGWRHDEIAAGGFGHEYLAGDTRGHHYTGVRLDVPGRKTGDYVRDPWRVHEVVD